MAHYIDKFVVVNEIERRLKRNEAEKRRIQKYLGKWDEGYFGGYEDALMLLKEEFLDKFEVKEVDLDKEINCKDVFIEKACELLARMIWEVTYEDLEGNSVQHYDKMEFIEDFKKYMKGE